jgi:hypothetical protein
MLNRRLVLVAILVGYAWSQQPAVSQGTQQHVQTSTRLVAVFSDLNNELFQAIQKRDVTGFERLVGEDFELRTVNTPDNPKSRDDWQRLAFRNPLQSFRTSKMAVRGLGDDVAIVSFVLEENRGRQSGTQKAFLVQAWSLQGQAWVCREQYVLPIVSPAAPSQRADRKPSGKD